MIKKKFGFLIFGILLLFVSCFLFLGYSPFRVQAALPAELQAQINATKRNRDALVEEQRRLETELNDLNKQSQTLGTAVKSLDATRKKLQNDINITKSKINSSNLSIRSLESTISDKERQIITHEGAIAEGIKALAEYDSHSFITDLFAYGEISEVWRDRAILSDLGVRLKDEISNLRETRYALNQEKTAKEKAKKDLESFQNQLAGQKTVVEENQNAKQELLNKTKSEEAAYQKLLQDNLERQRQSEQDISNLEEQLRITLDPSLFPKAKHGILDWPATSPYITNYFGRSNCSIYSGDCFHNGVDFRASMGTPVLAMHDGVVRGSDNTDRQKGCYSYGRWVLVDYDNGLSSIYAHLSALLVKDGERVEAGQVVAYSGGAPGAYGSGYSTGPHIHVGLLPTQGVQVSLFTTSRGCKQVYVPLAKGRDAYLNALDYLPKI